MIMQNTTAISRVMTHKPATVSPMDHLETVQEIFEKFGFHHVPVLDDGKLVGIVSYTDYLRVIQEVYGSADEQGRNQHLLQTIQVKQVMTDHPVCLSPSDTIEDALRIFKTNHFHAIPVIEQDGRLVGILSTHDLIKVLERLLAPEIDYASK
jgi:acetoin utilization protein AcuB